MGEWGWGGVGHALGFNYITLRLGPGYKDGPRGAGSGRVGWLVVVVVVVAVVVVVVVAVVVVVVSSNK